MGHPALAIANGFYGLAIQSNSPGFTHMKIQKLVYIAHGWNLGITGDPLIDESVLAWRYGPVVQSVWDQYKEFGRSPIDRPARSLRYGGSPEEPQVNAEDKWTVAMISRMWDVYGGLNAMQLSSMTHRPGSPWHTVAQEFDFELSFGVVIPDETIREYYAQKWNSLHQNK